MSSTQPVEGGRATRTTTVEAAANLTTEEYVRRVRPWVAVYPCLLVMWWTRAFSPLCASSEQIKRTSHGQ